MTDRKDDSPAAYQAAVANVAGPGSVSRGGGSPLTGEWPACIVGSEVPTRNWDSEWGLSLQTCGRENERRHARVEAGGTAVDAVGDRMATVMQKLLTADTKCSSLL